MIKKFNDFKINEDIIDFDNSNIGRPDLYKNEKYNKIKQNISRDDADSLLFEYYNKCMDEFNGSVSEEAIYMLLNDIYGEEIDEITESKSSIIKDELPSAIENYVDEIEKIKNAKDFRKILSKIKDDLSDNTYDVLNKMSDDELKKTIIKSTMYL